MSEGTCDCLALTIEKKLKFGVFYMFNSLIMAFGSLFLGTSATLGTSLVLILIIVLIVR